VAFTFGVFLHLCENGFGDRLNMRKALACSFVGKGRLVSMGKTIAFTEAELFDEAGDLIARGTFTSRLVVTTGAQG